MNTEAYKYTWLNTLGL